MLACIRTWGLAMPCFLTWLNQDQRPASAQQELQTLSPKSSPAAAPKLPTTVSLTWNSSSTRDCPSFWFNGTFIFPKRAIANVKEINHDNCTPTADCIFWFSKGCSLSLCHIYSLTSFWISLDHLPRITFLPPEHQSTRLALLWWIIWMQASFSHYANIFIFFYWEFDPFPCILKSITAIAVISSCNLDISWNKYC